MTLFPKSTVEINLDDLWEKIVDTKPEARNFSPLNGETLLRGDYNKGVLEFKKNPLRVDFIYRVKQDFHFKEDGSIEFISLGSFTDIHNSWISFCRKSLATGWQGNVSRVAFAATLLEQFADRKSAYKKINSYLPLNIASDQVENLALQVNKPIESKLESELVLNRLTQWRVLKATAHLEDKSSMVKNVPEIYLSNLELDINSKPESELLLEKVSLVELFEELVSVGLGISQNGIQL
jgi:hypothetical protein